MGLYETFGAVSRTIEPLQDFLHKSYDYVQVPDSVEEVDASIDGGSTGTRAILMKVGELAYYVDFLDKEQAIPSNLFTISRMVELPEPASDQLIDIMDSTITYIGQSVTPVVSMPTRILRAERMMAYNASETRIDSSGTKITDPVFFYNLIDALGYSTVAKFSGAIPSKVRVNLSVSLPPKENTTTAIKIFQENLSKFVWSLNNTNVSINFEINIKVVLTEPEAECKAYYAINRKPRPEIILHINGGGRSIGTEILENGVSVPTGRLPLLYGGTELLNNLATLCGPKTGGRILKRASLEKAIRTGFLTIGEDSINVVEEIKEVKNLMANQIFGDIKNHMFTGQSRFSQTDISCISFSGGIFEPGDYNYSMGQRLVDLFKNICPKAKFELYSESLITQGLFLALIPKAHTKDEIMGALQARKEMEDSLEESAATE
jgi:hypothetical protein